MSAEGTKLSPGDKVKTAGIRITGQVLEGPDRKGNFLCLFGQLQARLHESQLRKVDRPANKKKRQTASRERENGRAALEQARIDLHGLTTEEALSLLERTISSCLLENVHKLEVIHGLGTGTLKKAVHRYLASSHHVARFELDPGNTGTTMVWF